MAIHHHLKSLNSIISVRKCKEHPQEMLILSNDSWHPLLPPSKSNRQNYNHKAYFITGSFYISTALNLIENNGFCNDKTFYFETYEPIAVDIDEESDFTVAYSLFDMMTMNGRTYRSDFKNTGSD